MQNPNGGGVSTPGTVDVSISDNDGSGTPTAIYAEDFEPYATGTTSPGNGKWTLETSTADTGFIFEVANDGTDQALRANDIDDGDGTTSVVTWTSESIDISAYAGVDVALTLSETGDHEGTDFADVQYSTDGGTTYTTITNWNGLGSSTHTLVGNLPNDQDWGSATVTTAGLSGTTLRLRVRLKNNAGSEDLFLDDIAVTGGSSDGGGGGGGTPAASLLITEVMQNPDAVPDSDGEWFEVHNPSRTPVDMQGWTIRDTDTDTHTIGNSVVVPAGGYAVLCRNGTSSANGGVPCNYVYANIAIANGADELILEDGGGTKIDIIAYDDGPAWPDPTGASMVYTGTASENNNDGALWTTATASLGLTTDNGSPGLRGPEQTLAVTTTLQSTAGWRMLSAPVGGLTVGDLPGLVQGVSGSYPGADPNIYLSYDGPGSATDGQYWTAATSTSDPLEPGQGFIWYVFAQDLPLSVTTRQASPRVTQDVTVSIPESSEWHLIGNPYANPFDLSGLNLGTGFSSTVQAWDPTAGDGTGSYRLITQATDDSDVIHPWGAFFVEYNTFTEGATTTRSVTFNHTGQAPRASILYKRTPHGALSKAAPKAARTQGSVAFTLTGQASGQTVTYDAATRLVLRSDAQEGQDAYDASKLEPLGTTYGVLAFGPVSGDNLRAQASYALDLSGQRLEVPMHVQRQGTIDALTVKVNRLALPDGWGAQLIDQVEGSTRRLTDGFKYTFAPQAKATQQTQTTSQAKRTHSSALPQPVTLTTTLPNAKTRAGSKATASSPRFMLHVAPIGALPVELSGLTATADKRRVRMTWQTASETNNAGFYIEHKGDQGQWTDLGFIEGAGTTQTPQTYRFTTRRLNYGLHTMRLRQVDVDGSAHYSDPVTVRIALQQRAALSQPAPHPFRQETTVQLTVRAPQQVEAVLYDVLGRRVRTIYRGPVAAQQQKRLRIDGQGLASGLYLLRVSGTEFTKTLRLMHIR
ncbi:lamin tail domain-containing protein [Salisaeta longa]|uniref:lamin tail domain-containing protein n=1 Tax=Salisaeta longa TaxID=503170 RepID=UPI0003B6347A|nr:lamin tail domain-containing protein [Salisaeta longa]